MKKSTKERLLQRSLNDSEQFFPPSNRNVAVTLLTGEQIEGEIYNQNNLTISIATDTLKSFIKEIPWTAIKYIEWQVMEGKSGASTNEIPVGRE